MSNWISKAANAFKGDDSSSQAFELFCDCGQKHSGLRRQKWQRIVCRACGGSLFVLQRDPYPPPKEKPEQHPSRVDDDIETREVDDVEILGDAAHKKRDSYRLLPPVKAPPPVESRPKRPPPVVAAPPIVPPKSAGGFWKPFRVVIAVITLLGAGTGFLMFQSSQKNSAERSLRDAIDQIKDAFQKSEWVEARNQLEIAVKSLDRLGRDDADSNRYRQQLRETTAMTSLLSQPLSDLLTEAVQAQAAGDKDLLAFQSKVKGQWVVIDGYAEPKLNAKNRSRVQFRIPLPLTIGRGNQPVEVVIVSADLSRLMAKSESKPVVVAVQIDAIEPDPDREGWQIRAEPDSTVLWASRQTYEGIGYTTEDAGIAAGILNNQAQSLGVANEPKAE